VDGVQPVSRGRGVEVELADLGDVERRVEEDD
jgi:hypothetical protein